MHRHRYPAHKVRLFKGNGETTGTFSFPSTDPRFVKSDDIGLIAAQKAKAYNKDLEWDYLDVTFYSLIIEADFEENQIRTF